jgi:hypothetical protein
MGSGEVMSSGMGLGFVTVLMHDLQGLLDVPKQRAGHGIDVRGIALIHP